MTTRAHAEFYAKLGTQESWDWMSSQLNNLIGVARDALAAEGDEPTTLREITATIMEGSSVGPHVIVATLATALIRLAQNDAGHVAG